MNTVKISVLALVMLVTELCFADHANLFEAEVVNANSFRLEINQVAQGVKLKIKDQYGQILYKEQVEANEKYHKVINLSPLPNGDYQLELENATMIQTLPIKISTHNVVLNQMDVVEIFKPVVRQQESMISISMLNSKRKPLDISIYDTKNRRIHHQKLPNDMVIGQLYNLGNVQPGQYTINMRSGERSFSKSIILP